MLYTIFNIIKQVICVFFTGLVIKMMDDYIDRDIDSLSGQKNIFTLSNCRIIPYVLLIFGLACFINKETALTLFFASYSIGMMGTLKAKMPTSLYGYQESIIIIVLGVILFGITEMSSSIFIIACVHLLDEYIDYNKDKKYKKNWVFLLGKTEVLILGLIFLLSAIYMNPLKSILVLFLTYPVVYITYLLYTYLV